MTIYIQTEGTIEKKQHSDYSGIIFYSDELKIEQVNVVILNSEGKQQVKYKHRMKTLRKKLMPSRKFFDDYAVVIQLIIDLVNKNNSTVYCDLKEIETYYYILKNSSGIFKSYEFDRVECHLWSAKRSLETRGIPWRVYYEKDKVGKIFKEIKW